MELDPQSEENLWNLYTMYGASPRSLFLYADRPTLYDEIVTREIYSPSPDTLRGLLVSADKATNTSHFLVTTGPLADDRTRPEGKLTSVYVFARFCELVLLNRVEVLKDFYEALHLTPTTACSAGMVFEHRAHQFLREGRILDLLSMHQYIYTNTRYTTRML